jgi:hypothetical protein
MGVLWMRARAQLRGRARANLFLALLVGLAGALVLAAAAGARRSEAALPRFLAANQTVDAAVYVPLASPVVAPGKGVIVHADLWRRLSPPGSPVSPSFFVVRLDPAADRRLAILRLQHDFPNTVALPLKQPELTDLERVGHLPGLLAGLVALLALGTVTHALVTSVRRRRRDLATLKTLGFTRGQVSATVAWQATAFALLAAAVGVPLGIAGGRWAWLLVADQLGVVPDPVVPALPVRPSPPARRSWPTWPRPDRAGPRPGSGRRSCSAPSSGPGRRFRDPAAGGRGSGG